ncbi:hypothetical protein [Aeromonas veronii]
MSVALLSLVTFGGFDKNDRKGIDALTGVGRRLSVGRTASDA